MKRVLLLTLVIALTGCGSSSKKEEGSEQKIASEKKLSSLQNSDFEKVKEISYERRRDFFNLKTSKKDALLYESLERLDNGNFSELEKKEDDLSKIAALCYSGKYKEAEKKLDDIYRQYKQNPSYWNQVGNCFFLQGETRKALLYYNKAIGLNSNYGPSVNNLGLLYLKEGKDQKALSAFQRALEVSPSSKTPQFNIFQLYLKYGFYSKAEKFLKSLSRKAKEDNDLLAGFAVILLAKGKYQRALSIFRKLERNLQFSPFIGINYALAEKLAGDKNKAKDILSKTQKSLDLTWKRKFQEISLSLKE